MSNSTVIGLSGAVLIPGPPGGVTDHGALTGLVDDDHTQYHNDARGDARYPLLAHTHAMVDVTDSTWLSTIAAEPIGDLSDVTITTLAAGELLKWTGTAWINNTLAEAGIASDSHTHTGVYEPVFTKNTAFNKNFGAIAGDVCEGDDSRLSDSRTPTAHTHETLYTPLQVTLNTQAGTAYTLVLTDAAKYLRTTNAAGVTITVPTNATVAFPTGTQINVHQAGVGQITIAGAGVTLNTPETLKLRKQHSSCTLIKVGVDEWDVVGDMEAV